jgi:hypothetical protein
MQNALEWPLPLAHQPMQNRPVQTGSRTEIGADSISNRTKIGIDATNRTRLTKISAVPNRTKIGANPIPQLTEISAVPNRTKIGADPIPQLTKIGAVPNCIKIGADHIYIIAKSSSIMRMPHARANRTSRVLIKKVFNDKVI